MESTEHYLEEFNPSDNRNKWLSASIVSICLYLLYLILDIFIDFGSFRMNMPVFEWEIIAITIMLPFIGCLMLYKKKRAGWIIVYTYFSLLSFALLISWMMKFAESSQIDMYNYRPFILTILSTASVVLLLTPSVRQALRIKLWVLMTITGLSLIVAFLLMEYAQ